MSQRHDIDLMQHADGELDGLDDEIGRDAKAQAKVDAIGELGEVVRSHLELSADAVPSKRFGSMWSQIEKSITNEASEPKPVASRASLPRRILRWFDQHRGHIISGAVGAGAVAALALVLRTQGASTGSGTTAEPIPVSPVVHRPAEIEALDTPEGTGTVFNLEDEDGNTTVIWVTPDDTVEGI